MDDLMRQLAMRALRDKANQLRYEMEGSAWDLERYPVDKARLDRWVRWIQDFASDLQLEVEGDPRPRILALGKAIEQAQKDAARMI